MMRRLSRRFIPVVMAILIIGQALAAPVSAVDYNGNPDTGPDPSNGIIFYDGKQAGVCAASSSGTAKQVAIHATNIATSRTRVSRSESLSQRGTARKGGDAPGHGDGCAE